MGNSEATVAVQLTTIALLVSFTEIVDGGRSTNCN